MQTNVSMNIEIKMKREKEIYMGKKKILRQNWIPIQKQKLIHQTQGTLFI